MLKEFDRNEIEECMLAMEANVEVIYTKQYRQFKSYCDKLFTYAIEEQSDYLFAQAYYYLMQYYASDNNYVNTVSCAMEGIKYQKKVQCHNLVARSYNVLGIFMEASNEISKGVEYLLLGIDYCNSHNLDYEHGILASNLARIFQRNSNFDRALHYYEEAEHFYNRDLLKDSRKAFYKVMICHFCDKCYCLLSVGKEKELEIAHKKLKQYLDITSERKDNIQEFSVNTYYAAYYQRYHDVEKMNYYLRLARKNFDKAPNYITDIDDIKMYILLHKKLGRYEELVIILDYFIERCEKDNAPFYIASFFISERISYAKRVKDMSSYVLYTEKFLDLFLEEQNKNSDVSLYAEKNHKEYYRIQKQQEEILLQNEQLLQESRHDTLTNLPNRTYLNDFAEKMLVRALRNQAFLGVEILDIDHFKWINDSYGHIVGDKYLTELAKQLQRITEEYADVFTARYGGDEFVIIYYNKTSREIQYIMERLKKYVSDIKLPDKGIKGLSMLTISQGCCNMVPNSVTRIWDYLSTADVSLYDVKAKGRNDFKVHDSFLQSNSL